MHVTDIEDASRPRPRIAITMGDPAGIGPEVVIKALMDARIARFLRPVIVGSAEVFRARLKHLRLDAYSVQVVNDVPERWPGQDVFPVLDTAPGEPLDFKLGEVSGAAGGMAMRSVERALEMCLNGDAEAMVTAPISKDAVNRAGYRIPGHTEFIADKVAAPSYTMLMVSDDVRVGLVTGHIPIWDVPKGVTEEAILDKIAVMDRSLREDFGIMRPRIAVLGLNPHAGDGGLLGREESDTIIPAINRACENGLLAFGPFPADGFFASGGFRHYDAVLAMYHDQGLIPFKVIAFENGVNFTAGIPIIRTSPDHGTAFAIAGRGVASPSSMIRAIYLAADIARVRMVADGS
jgi:4-hydroxythreonine-4-phosphate dehydrogenase